MKEVILYRQFFDNAQITDEQIINLLIDNDCLDDFETDQYLPTEESIRELQF